jgi:hypothetical protein
LPDDYRLEALPLNGFTSSYERIYQKKGVTKVPKDWLLGLPCLIECPGRGWAAITEANLTDSAGMYLANTGEWRNDLTSRLSPLPATRKSQSRQGCPTQSRSG